MFDVVQRRGADLQPRLARVGIRSVPFSDLRVQVPAVVIEPCRAGDAADVGEGLVFEFTEADDDVRDLDAGVVDVVLDLDRAPLEPQQAPEGVAERRVPQVADVGRLIRIDSRVLDDHFSFRLKAEATRSL